MADTMEQKSVEIVLGDGSKITGANLDEALKNAAKRIEDRTKDVKEAQEKAEKIQREWDGYKQSEEEKRAEAERQAALERQRAASSKDKNGFDKMEYYRLLNDDPVAAANYVDASRLGIDDPSQVPARFNNMATQIGEINQERVASAFWRQHPEFPQEIAAARALDKRVTQFIGEGHPFNVRTFNMAYDELVGEETIKPMEMEDKEKDEKNKQRAEEDRPNPSLSGGGREGAEDAEARKMDNMDDKALEAYAREKGWLR